MAKEGREIRPLVAGNWKMNGHKASLVEALAVRDALIGPLASLPADLMIARRQPLLPDLLPPSAKGPCCSPARIVTRNRVALIRAISPLKC